MIALAGHECHTRSLITNHRSRITADSRPMGEAVESDAVGASGEAWVWVFLWE
jgi:hypothetical protein